jgi:2Fe-2S ferredoxin
MLTIAFIHPDGRVEGVEAQADQSAMRAAIDNSILGIVGECGGNAMCATCHVYVDVGWLDRLPAMSDEEDALLDGAAAPRKPNSRLSCQIKMTPQLDGVILHLPKDQV